MTLFKIIYGLDAIVAIIIFYFFLVGLKDGSISGWNSGAWLMILAALAGILGGGAWLKSHDHTFFAFAILLILAIPAILFGLYFLIAATGNGRWN